MRPSSIAQLPEAVPIFPLAGVLLLPFGRLPLNIFEPRYLAMVRHALATDWLIGMVQPRDAKDPASEPDVYRVACAGRLTRVEETEDGRYLIMLSGLCRFDIEAELPLQSGFRRARAAWGRFADDFRRPDADAASRERLLPVLREYFAGHKISADWDNIEQLPGNQLVNTLAMQCPFDPREKQALLESPGPRERAELMISLLAMAALDRSGEADVSH